MWMPRNRLRLLERGINMDHVRRTLVEDGFVVVRKLVDDTDTLAAAAAACQRLQASPLWPQSL